MIDIPIVRASGTRPMPHMEVNLKAAYAVKIQLLKQRGLLVIGVVDTDLLNVAIECLVKKQAYINAGRARCGACRGASARSKRRYTDEPSKCDAAAEHTYVIGSNGQKLKY